MIVRTLRKTNYETKLKRKVTTSGCAIGTVFGDVYDEILKTKIKSKKKIKHSWIYEISKKINLTPSLYLEAGAIHGCAIIENNNPIIYFSLTSSTKISINTSLNFKIFRFLIVRS